jgi:hypothetical protein
MTLGPSCTIEDVKGETIYPMVCEYGLQCRFYVWVQGLWRYHNYPRSI